MRMRRPVFAAVFAVSVSLLVAVPPAQAAPAPPKVSGIDTSVPGKVTATLTTSAPYAFVRLRQNYAEYEPVTLVAGTGTFTLETWGFGQQISVDAIACSDEQQRDCSYQQYLPDFRTNDPVPQVTWSEDETIGPGQTIDITVSDPQGGGKLVAEWQDFGYTQEFELDRAGTKRITVQRSRNAFMKVRRCSTTTSFTCSDFAPAVQKWYDVRLISQPQLVGTRTDGAIVPISSASPETTITVLSSETGPTTYSLTWNLVYATTHEEVAGAGGTLSGTVGPHGEIPVVIDGADLAEGSYKFVATYTEESPDFGTLQGSVFSNELVVVDRTPNPGTTSFTASATTIHPLTGFGFPGYPGYVTFALGRKVVSGDSVEVRDRNGSLVRLVSGPTLEWNGKDLANRVVPPGTYTATLTDQAGNLTAGARPVRITVTAKKVHREVLRRTVTAAASLDDAYVGRCSTLRRPSLRGWKGSLGLYANKRCKSQKGRASVVSTVHALQLPPAVRYSRIQVAFYGGAAKSRRGSKVVLSYLGRNRKWSRDKVMNAKMGLHEGEMVFTDSDSNTSPYVFSDRYLVWGLFTAYKNRYDVKSFTVTVEYLTVR